MPDPDCADPTDTTDSIRRGLLFGGLAAAGYAAASVKAQPTGAAPRALDQAGASEVVLGRGNLAVDSRGRANALPALRRALQARDTPRDGAFTVSIPEGTYFLQGEERVLASIQGGTRLAGGVLEGTRLRADPRGRAQVLLGDDPAEGQGSAAKVEIYNLTLDGAGSPALRALLDLGTGGSVQFGTYGRIDNLMARDAPNATAFNLNANIVAVGELYSMNTRDGIVTADGGSGCVIRGAYPYGFSRYGIRLGGIGDAVLNGEGEAPTSDDAVYLYGSRSFIAGFGSHIVAVGTGTTMKRVFVIDTDVVGDWALGPWLFVRNDRTQRFGDFERPTYRGTAAAVGANTLTDPAQDWELDELKGWAVLITAGKGAGNWSEVAGNTRDTLRILSRDWSTTGPTIETVPASGSRYALAPALCRAKGGGFASSKVMTLAEVVIRSLFSRVVRAGSLLVGASNDAVTLRGIVRLGRQIALPALPPGRPLRISVPAPDVRAGDFVTVSAPALRESGVRIEAESGDRAVLLYCENRGDVLHPAGTAAISLLVTMPG